MVCPKQKPLSQQVMFEILHKVDNGQQLFPGSAIIAFRLRQYVAAVVFRLRQYMAAVGNHLLTLAAILGQDCPDGAVAGVGIQGVPVLEMRVRQHRGCHQSVLKLFEGLLAGICRGKVLLTLVGETMQRACDLRKVGYEAAVVGREAKEALDLSHVRGCRPTPNEGDLSGSVLTPSAYTR